MTFPFRFSGLALFLVGGMLLLLACPNNVNAHPQCDRFRNKMGSIIYPAPGVTGAINVSFAQLLSFCSQLPTLGEEQVWWHYGPYSECLPYIASGKISGQYIQRMIDPSNTDPTIDPIAAAGRGFYVAKDPISSSKYGLCSTYVSFGADTLVLDLSILGRVFSGEIAPHSQSKVWLGSLIPFVDVYRNGPVGDTTWAVVHTADLLGKVEVGPADGPLDPDRVHHTSFLQSDDMSTSLLWDTFGTLSSSWLAATPMKNKDTLLASTPALQQSTTALLLRDPLRILLDKSAGRDWTIGVSETLANFWSGLVRSPEVAANLLSFVGGDGLRRFGNGAKSKGAWSAAFADTIWPQFSTMFRVAPYRNFCQRPTSFIARAPVLQALQANRHFNVSFGASSARGYNITITHRCVQPISLTLRNQVFDLASSLHGELVTPDTVIRMASDLCSIQPGADRQCLAAKAMADSLSSEMMFWIRPPVSELLWAMPTDALPPLLMRLSSEVAFPELESSLVQFTVGQWLYHGLSISRPQAFFQLPEFVGLPNALKSLGPTSRSDFPQSWRDRLESGDWPGVLDELYGSQDWDRSFAPQTNRRSSHVV